ncbi:ribosomal RNA-processing protein 1, partial [Tremellales sp. Uapishka_1]
MPAAVSSRKGKGRAVVETKVEAVLPLGKQLAHTDKKIRDRAVENLAAFLSRGGESGESSTYVNLSESEMAKLWKGLFYCFWMSDKPLIQQSLASDLASLLLKINPKTSSSDSETERFQASLSFLDGFWKAMIREWSGLDRLRMDKFYLLIRKFVNFTFQLLGRNGWEKKEIASVNEVLSRNGGPLTFEDSRVPSSIGTHLADIYLEELDKVLALPEVDSQSPCPVVSLLFPHILLLTRTSNSTIYTRLMLSIFTPLLSALSLASSSTEPSSKKRREDEPVYAHIIMCSKLGPDGLKKDLLKELFKVASEDKSGESNRRKVYKLWREEGGDDDEE